MADQAITERFENVLNKGRMLLTHSLIRNPRKNDTIDLAPFLEWQTQSLTLLRVAFGADHDYRKTFEAHTTYCDIAQAYPMFVQQGLGVLQAASDDISKGWTWQFKELVHADVFTDFLDMADFLISDGGFKDPAAVLAGGVLEEYLRKLCQKNGIATQVQGRRGMELKKASSMNDDLVKQHVYSQAEWRSVQAWLDHRNDAAHGHFQKYDEKQITLMIDGIRDFIVRHPA